MRSRRRDSVRCSCVCADGSPCGRRVTDCSQPPVCHVHRAVAAGNPHNGGSINARRSKTPEQVLEDLLHSKDESVRLRAADAFLKRQEREGACPRCQAHIVDDGPREQAIQRMTDEQRVRVRALIDEIKAICAAALSQPPNSDRERHRNIDAPPERHASPVSADIAVTPETDMTAEEPNQLVTRQVDPQRYAEVADEPHGLRCVAMQLDVQVPRA